MSLDSPFKAIFTVTLLMYASNRDVYFPWLSGVAYTAESGLSGVAYTAESGLSGVAYTAESFGVICQTFWALPMLLKEQFLKMQTVGVNYYLMGRDSCLKNLFNLVSSHWLSGVFYTAESS